MSGYASPGWPNVLDDQAWALKAEDLRILFGVPGDKSKATHVEVRVLAYLLARHALHKFSSEHHRSELECVLPFYDLQPVIAIGRSCPCCYCAEFGEHFGDKFAGFNVSFQYLEDLVAVSVGVPDYNERMAYSTVPSLLYPGWHIARQSFEAPREL